MGKSGTLTVRVVSDTKAAEQGLDRFGKKVETTGQKLSRAGDKMTMFATVPIAAAMGLAAKAASDLNENLSKSNTVFGESAKEIENWADGAAEGFGQSKREALGAASTFGNLFVQLGVGTDQAADMSMAMVELASDFASFHNADITEVIDAQSAAFRGEYDALQRFVPTINAATVEQKALAQTGKATTKELTAQDKALAVQTLMMEGAGDATGDFARTQDSAANSMRTAQASIEDASAEIGSALLPLVAKAAGGVADLAGGFADLPGPVQNSVLALAGMIAAVGPVLKVAGSLKNLSAAAADGSRSAALASGAIKGLAAAGAVVGTLYAVKAGLDALGLSAQGLQVDIEGVARASSEELAAEFLKMGESSVTAGMQLEVFDQVAQANIGTAKRLRDELKLQGEDVTALDAILQEHIGAQRQVKADTDAAAEAVDGFAGSTEGAQAPTDKLTDKIDDEKAAADRLQAAIDKVSDATDRLIGSNLSAEQATLRAEEAHVGLTETLKENGATLDIHTEKGRANREAITSTADAALNHVEALKKQGASTDEVNFFLSTHVERLKETMRQAGLTEGEIDSYIKTLGLTPKNIATLVQLNGVAEAERDLNWVARDRTTRIYATTIGETGVGRRAFHAGGTYAAPRPGGEGLVILRDGERVSTPTEPASHGGMPDPDEWGRAAARAMAAETRRLSRAG